METTTSIQDSTVSADQLGQTVALVLNGTLSNFMAQTMLQLLYKSEQGRIPAEVAHERNWKLISDPDTLRAMCRRVVEHEPPDKLQQYHRGGKSQVKLLRYFSGKVMADCQGNADPELMRHVLLQVLDELRPNP